MVYTWVDEVEEGNMNPIGQNVARFRLDQNLSQQDLADKVGVSRLALGKIERGEVEPRSKTLNALASALDVSLEDLLTTPRPLESVRFRARKRVHGREQILAEVSRWLEAYEWLEKELQARPAVHVFKSLQPSPLKNPKVLAGEVRKAMKIKLNEPVRDICGLLEESGIKVLLLEKKSDAFFGLSVGLGDGGPAVVVNTWDRISVERWIFTAAHELGHLLLHKAEYKRTEMTEPTAAEREADTFASYFLMPEELFSSEWEETRGHALVHRVLKVKRIFRVSYKTVLYRLVETGRESRDVWQSFQVQHKHYFGRTLKKADEPVQLKEREFTWNWSCAGEPQALTESDFVEDRLCRLVRKAFEEKKISLGRAAEILGVTREEMRQRAAHWTE